MKIGVDARSLFGAKTGVGQYIDRLFRALSKIDSINQYDLFMVRFFLSKNPIPEKFTAKNFRFKIINLIPTRVFTLLQRKHLLPPMEVLLGGKDLYIFPNFVSLPARKTPSILFVYDLSYELHDQYVAPRNAAYLKEFVPESIKRAAMIVTISQNAKEELCDFYKIKPSKVIVINPALDHAVFYPRRENEVAQVKKKFNIKGDYILFTGTLEPRKNIIGILDAYKSLPADLKKKYSLVLAGGKGWLDESIQEKLESLHDHKIICTGYFDDTDVPALYSGATAFIYPSFYEGFGMPPLEAMACGTPIITSDNSSLPEVVGSAAILVKADQQTQLNARLLELLQDEKLRKKLSKAGLERAKLFTWEKSAMQLQTLIETFKDSNK